MKKTLLNNLVTFLGVFFVMLLSTQTAFAADGVEQIAKQVNKIFNTIKPLIFLSAAGWLIYTGIDGIIKGDFEWNKTLKVVGPLILVLIAGYLVEAFSGGEAEVYFNK